MHLREDAQAPSETLAIPAHNSWSSSRCCSQPVAAPACCREKLPQQAAAASAVATQHAVTFR